MTADDTSRHGGRAETRQPHNARTGARIEVTHYTPDLRACDLPKGRCSSDMQMRDCPIPAPRSAS
jgi:hypothetical protein